MSVSAFSWPEVAAKITHPISLAAYGVAAVVFILSLKKTRVPKAAWIVIVSLVLVPVLTSAAIELFRIQRSGSSLHRVRVTVLDPSKMPVDDAKVWSSLGGETKRVPGGWEIDVPKESKPSDGKLTIYASVESAFLHGSTDILLGDDYSPAVTVALQRDGNSKVRGIVVDHVGHAVKNANVYVVGYSSEAVRTGEDGNFELPAHAAEGQQVELHAEARGKIADIWHPAGKHPATLRLH